MSIHKEKLDLAEEQADKNEPLQATVREFLGWFGFERRGWRVVRDIRATLREHNLTTQPDFEHTWFDGSVAFVRPSTEAERVQTANAESVLNMEDVADATIVKALVGGAVEDPAFRIGKLDAANTAPASIPPTANLQEAITVMLRDNFSQLPVMTSEREVKGAITWQSIAKRTGLGHQCETVQDCMDSSVEIVTEDDSLFRVIERIRENDFVLVRAKDRRICGIVTVADLSETLDELGRPFLLLSEIENHIRGLIDGKFSREELKAAKNPGDEEREVSDVSDLTFGEYVRLLQNPANWQKLGLPIDRKTFVDDMERVNLIRNDVMHFDPDGIGEDDLETLRKSSRFIQELRDLAVSQEQCDE
ncbi:MAG: CBS domain-containing protein [Pirellulales bacterium]|nr:CBS domain-containing protein [Pirellulales bacterium]